MDKNEVKRFLDQLSVSAERNMVIIDFANVTHWEDVLGWRIDISKLRNLVRHMTIGKQYLRRFYYGQDYGPRDTSTTVLPWSQKIYERARNNGFEIITKRVKYIVDNKRADGLVPKCDMDVEMVIDLLNEEHNYDKVVVFSGDGDLAPAYKFLKDKYNKHIYVIGARDMVGREVVDATKSRTVDKLLFVEDFEYRLAMDGYQSKTRFRGF